MVLVEIELADACSGEGLGSRAMVVSPDGSRGRAVVHAFGVKTLDRLGSADAERVNEEQSRNLSEGIVKSRGDRFGFPDDTLAGTAAKNQKRSLPQLVALHGNGELPVPLLRNDRDDRALQTGALGARAEALV